MAHSTPNTTSNRNSGPDIASAVGYHSGTPCGTYHLKALSCVNIVLVGVLLVFFATVSFAAAGDIIELRLQRRYCTPQICEFDWEQADLSTIVANVPQVSPAVGDPFPYLTPDGVYRIVYRGVDNQIHQLRRFVWSPTQATWLQEDLPPAPPAAGNPFAYVTPDGIPRIVYVGQDGHIHEFRLQVVWQQTDLSIVSGDANPSAYGDAFAYVTPDGIARVVYAARDTHIHELRLQSNSWLESDLSIVTFGRPTPPAGGHLFPYVTRDGIPRIFYRGVEEHIHALTFVHNFWSLPHWVDDDLSASVMDTPLAPPAAGNPFAYVTPDGILRVVYTGQDDHIHELRLQGGWQWADLSAIVTDGPPASPAVGNPFAYVTPDQVPRVIYAGLDDHIHELRLDGTWQQLDLSAGAANPPFLTFEGSPRATITPNDQIARVVFRSVF